jgi:hypothetical protein
MKYLILLSAAFLAQFYMRDFYINQLDKNIKQVQEENLKLKEENLQLCEASKNELKLLFTKEIKQLKIEQAKAKKQTIKDELQFKVEKAYALANVIYARDTGKNSKRALSEKIKDALTYTLFNNEEGYIFLTDFNGNLLLKGSQKMPDEAFKTYLDGDNRSIVLEEIQKVRKHGSGFLESRLRENNLSEIIYVKNLGFNDWFIGTSAVIE